MRLDSYSCDALYMAAIKAEIGAAGVYYRLAGTVRSGYLRRKLMFLASEEQSHRRDLSKIYLKEFGKRFVRLPVQTPVPMPRMIGPGPKTTTAEVLESAKAAEAEARKFYQAFSRLYPEGSAQATHLVYLSSMEKGHFQLLQNELAQLPPEECGGQLYEGLRPGARQEDDEPAGPLPRLPASVVTEGLMLRTAAGQRPARPAAETMAPPRKFYTQPGRWAMETPDSPVLRRKAGRGRG